MGTTADPELARRLNLPARTWYNYETGVTVPAEVLLGFIDQTGANPIWLLSGEGPRYRRGHDDRLLSELSPIELIRRGLEKLEQEPSDVVIVAPENLPGEVKSDFVAVSLVPLEATGPRADRSRVIEGYIMAYRQWLPNPPQTVGRAADRRRDAPDPADRLGRGHRPVDAPTRPSSRARIVAACPEGVPMIRWLDVSGRHLILRPEPATAGSTR